MTGTLINYNSLVALLSLALVNVGSIYPVSLPPRIIAGQFVFKPLQHVSSNVEQARVYYFQ